MNNPFTPAGGPFAGRPGFGLGPDTQRRALHGAKRRARQEFFEHLREHAPDHDGPLGFGPGFVRIRARVRPGFRSGVRLRAGRPACRMAPWRPRPRQAR